MKRKNIAALLLLLPASIIWGQTLNPIEKEKINLPALPSTGITNSLRSSGQVDYSKGTFIVNEDWYGHQNSTVNFLSDDGKWTLRAFQKENPGHQLGCTSQFGTIYGDHFFIMSKQEKDPAAAIVGSRLAVINAKTMKVIKEFTKIGNADGRSFLGVDEHTGYIGTSSGIYLFDIDKMEIGEQIAGTGNSTGSLYAGQIGTMIRVNDRVFAVHQKDGLLVINAKTHEIETTLLKPSDNNGRGLGSIVLSKDGTIWASPTTDISGTGGSLPLIWKVDPVTLTIQQVDIPTANNIEEIPNSWYAWTADGFCASTQENKIYWKGQGSGSWFTGYKIFCYDIDKNDFYKVFDFGKVEGDWRLYGTGFRIDPVSDDMYCFWYHEFLNPEHELAVVGTDGRGETNGTIKGRYPYDISNYWFPALPVFPDNEVPVIQSSAPKEVSLDETNTQVSIPLEQIVKDGDNMTAAIVMTATMSDEHQKLITVNVQNCKLVIQPVEASVQSDKTIPVHLKFNSNGKIAETDINVLLKKGTGAPFAITESKVSIEKGKTATLTIKGMEDEKATWESSDESIAKVSEGGVVTAVAPGTITITATSTTREDVKATCEVTVKRESLYLSASELEIFDNGQTQQIKVTAGWGGKGETLTWESSDATVLEIASSTPMFVNYKPLKVGSAKIIGKITKDGTVLATAECTITVKALIPVEKIELIVVGQEQPGEEPVSLEINKKVTLEAKVYPENASIKDIDWMSSNTSAFTVNNGIITAVGNGTSEITVKSKQGKEEVTSDPIKLSCFYELNGIHFTQQIYGYSNSMMQEYGTVTAAIVCDPVTPPLNTNDISWEFVTPEEWENSSFAEPDDYGATSANGLKFTISPSPENWDGEPFDFYTGKVPLKCTIIYNGKEYTAECTINFAEELAGSFKLENKSVLLKPDETFQLKYNLNGNEKIKLEEPESPSVLFYSSNDEIASVDENGIVTAKSKGVATITANVSDGSFSEDCQILVGDTWATKVKCAEDTIRVTMGKSIQLSATVEPENASFPSVTWSSNTSLLTKDGVFTTHNSAHIKKYLMTATSLDEKASNTCVVYVIGEKPLTGLNLSSDEISVDINDLEDDKGIVFSKLFNIGFIPGNATLAGDPGNRYESFISSDESILKIGTTSGSGYEGYSYIPVKVGTAQVTITARENNIHSIQTVHVTDRNTGITGIFLDASSLMEKAGKTFTIGHHVTSVESPYLFDKSVTWESSDPTVATVNKENGEITTLKEGETVIRATTNVGGFTTTCHLGVVKGDVKVTGVKLNNTSLNLITGASALLTATVEPSDAKNANVNWKSENTAIATISEAGEVKAIAPGTTTITVTTEDGGFTATCQVTVKDLVIAVTGITLNQTSVDMKKGESILLRATVNPNNATNKSVTWLSSEEDVATVNSIGYVEAREAGSTTILAITADGKYDARCKVTVYNPNATPEVITKDTSATITFTKVDGAVKYNLAVYRYVNNTPVLDSEYVTDTFGNIISGLKSTQATSSASNKVAVNIVRLKPNTEYIVKITALDKNEKAISSTTSDSFTTFGSAVNNEAISTEQQDIYYQKGTLIFKNMESYTCYLVNMEGRIISIYKVKSDDERIPAQLSEGVYVISAIKGNKDFSKKLYIH